MIFAWGSNRYGQCLVPAEGDDKGEEPRSVASSIHAVIGRNVAITTVAAGVAHSLILTEFGDVFASGRSKEGQLGLGLDISEADTSPRTLYPVEALKPWRIAMIDCGSHHSFAVSSTGKAFEWGLLLPTDDTESVQKSDSDNSLWALRRQGGGTEFDDDHSAFTRRVVTQSLLLHLQQGSEVKGAMDQEDAMKLLKENDRRRVPIHQPRESPGLEDVCVGAVACGFGHTVVADSSGGLLACGYNEKGQLGNGCLFHSVRFAVVPFTGNVCAGGTKLEHASPFNHGLRARVLACGDNHTAAILNGGRLVTWGLGTFGQLGLGKAIKECCSPKLVDLDDPAAEVACGTQHTLVLMRTGKLFVFGHRDALGVAAHSERRPVLNSEFGDRRVSRLFAGGGASFVVAESEGGPALHSWGYNLQSHLGQNSFGLQQLRPNPVALPPHLVTGNDMRSFAAGSAHCVAVFELSADRIVLPMEVPEPYTRNTRLLAMLQDKDTHDILVQCATGDMVGAHRTILRLRCPTLLTNFLQEAHDDKDTTKRATIQLREHSIDCVRALLEYLYCDFCRASHAIASELRPLAETLGLGRLAASLGEASASGGDGEGRWVRTAKGRWVQQDAESANAAHSASCSASASTYARDLERLVTRSLGQGVSTADAPDADVMELAVRELNSDVPAQYFRIARPLMLTADVFRAMVTFAERTSKVMTTIDVVADDVDAFGRLLRFLATGDRSIVPSDPYGALAVLVEAHSRGLTDLVGAAEHRLQEVVGDADTSDLEGMERVASLYGLDRISGILAARKSIITGDNNTATSNNSTATVVCRNTRKCDGYAATLSPYAARKLGV